MTAAITFSKYRMASINQYPNQSNVLNQEQDDRNHKADKDEDIKDLSKQPNSEQDTNISKQTNDILDDINSDDNEDTQNDSINENSSYEYDYDNDDDFVDIEKDGGCDFEKENILNYQNILQGYIDSLSTYLGSKKCYDKVIQIIDEYHALVEGLPHDPVLKTLQSDMDSKIAKMHQKIQSDEIESTLNNYYSDFLIPNKVSMDQVEKYVEYLSTIPQDQFQPIIKKIEVLITKVINTPVVDYTSRNIYNFNGYDGLGGDSDVNPRRNQIEHSYVRTNNHTGQHNVKSFYPDSDEDDFTKQNTWNTIYTQRNISQISQNIDEFDDMVDSHKNNVNVPVSELIGRYNNYLDIIKRIEQVSQKNTELTNKIQTVYEQMHKIRDKINILKTLTQHNRVFDDYLKLFRADLLYGHHIVEYSKFIEEMPEGFSLIFQSKINEIAHHLSEGKRVVPESIAKQIFDFFVDLEDCINRFPNYDKNREVLENVDIIKKLLTEWQVPDDHGLDNKIKTLVTMINEGESKKTQAILQIENYITELDNAIKNQNTYQINDLRELVHISKFIESFAQTWNYTLPNIRDKIELVKVIYQNRINFHE